MIQLQLMGKIFIFLLIGCTSALEGPRTALEFLGRSLSVTCHYHRRYRAYYKYWCKGADWNYCTEVVKTRGSEAEAKAGGTSIKDNHTCSCFTVTLENLREEDAGKYWCAIEKAGQDIGFQVNVVPESCCYLTGPQRVDAFLGSPASVVCEYDPKYQQNKKYWCRRIDERNCPAIVSTTGSELLVTKNRFSITDNHSLSQFTINIDNVTSNDSGTYSCAVTRGNGLDLMASVNVTVLSASQPDILDHNGTFPTYQIYVPFLILICLKMLIFLAMVLAVIWMHRRSGRHADEGTPETHP